MRMIKLKLYRAKLGKGKWKKYCFLLYMVVFHYEFFLFSILWKKLVLCYSYLVVTDTNVLCCRVIHNNFLQNLELC